MNREWNLLSEDLYLPDWLVSSTWDYVETETWTEDGSTLIFITEEDSFLELTVLKCGLTPPTGNGVYTPLIPSRTKSFDLSIVSRINIGLIRPET